MRRTSLHADDAELSGSVVTGHVRNVPVDAEPLPVPPRSPGGRSLAPPAADASASVLDTGRDAYRWTEVAEPDEQGVRTGPQRGEHKVQTCRTPNRPSHGQEQIAWLGLKGGGASEGAERRIGPADQGPPGPGSRRCCRLLFQAASAAPAPASGSLWSTTTPRTTRSSAPWRGTTSCARGLSRCRRTPRHAPPSGRAPRGEAAPDGGDVGLCLLPGLGRRLLSSREGHEHVPAALEHLSVLFHQLLVLLCEAGVHADVPELCASAQPHECKYAEGSSRPLCSNARLSHGHRLRGLARALRAGSVGRLTRTRPPPSVASAHRCCLGQPDAQGRSYIFKGPMKLLRSNQSTFADETLCGQRQQQSVNEPDSAFEKPRAGGARTAR